MLASCLAVGLVLIPFTRAGQTRRPVPLPHPEPPPLRLSGNLDREASVAIRVGFEIDGQIVHEISCRSDDRGRYSVEWGESEAWAVAALDCVSTFFAEVIEAGYQKRIQRERWVKPARVQSDQPSPLLTLSKLPLVEGSEVEVVVVDPGGQPVRARLEAWRRCKDGEWQGSEADEDLLATGRHRVYLREPTPEVLRAVARGLGAGVAELGARQPLQIVLTGFGELRGTLLDLSGRPIARAPLRADLQGEPCLYGPFSGIATDTVGTDAQGRFSFRGLVRGDYAVTLESASPNSSLACDSYPTGSAPLTVVARIHCLDVPLLDEQGQPVGDAEAVCARRRDSEVKPLVSWDAVPRAPACEAGSRRFYLAPGSTYLASLWSPSRGIVQQEIAPESMSFSGSTSVRLPIVGESGTMRVRAFAPAGTDMSAYRCRLTLREPISRQVMADHTPSRLESGAVAWERDVCAGIYLVTCEPSRPLICGLSPRVAVDLVSRERELVVRAGEVTEVDLSLATGSR